LSFSISQGARQSSIEETQNGSNQDESTELHLNSAHYSIVKQFRSRLIFEEWDQALLKYRAGSCQQAIVSALLRTFRNWTESWTIKDAGREELMVSLVFSLSLLRTLITIHH
jgi:hypothetical protein